MRAITTVLFRQLLKAIVTMLAIAFFTSVNSANATPTWVQVSTGGAAACGVQTDHTLWCWGMIGRWYGTTSRGKSYDFGPIIPTPTLMSLDADWQSVSVSADENLVQEGETNIVDLFPATACALKFDGSRYCWGHDFNNGVLGMGGPIDIIENFEPQPAPDQVQFTQLSMGSNHSCGVTASNHLWCWGDNTYGQLGVSGLPTDEVQWSPRRVSAGNNWAFVTVGHYHTCALKLDGTRYCWGRNTNGQLGVGDGDNRSAPTHRTDEGAWRSIAAGDDHTCGITSWGNLYCWGDNYFGQLGHADSDAYRVRHGGTSYHPVPEVIGKWSDWDSVSPGGRATCGLRSGHRYCWGVTSDENELAVSAKLDTDVGDGTGRYVIRPTGLSSEIKRGTQWASISVSLEYMSHGCGIQLDGALWCWGWNDESVVGIGDTDWGAVYGTPVRIDYVR